MRLCLQIPYVGLNFAVYESLKDWLIKTKPYGLVDNSELSVGTRLACGAAAGTVGQTVAYPLDVIRRRMQMVGWNNAASVVIGDGRSKASLEYTGMVDAFRKTVRHEGFGALYKGLVPNSVKVSLLLPAIYALRDVGITLGQTGLTVSNRTLDRQIEMLDSPGYLPLFLTLSDYGTFHKNGEISRFRTKNPLARREGKERL
jgi:hypothetical protein